MWSLIILILLIIINTRDVSKFGESEYWLSFVKVATVVIFIIVGTVVDAQGFPGDEGPVGFKNWQVEGLQNGVKNGFGGIFSVFAVAFFAFGGTGMSCANT
jgi:amino acid permease